MVEYLDFVEEYKGEKSLSMFDKVKIITSRSRDLYEGKVSKAAAKDGLESRKPTTVAHYELINEYIKPDIHEKEEKTEEYLDDIEME